MPEKPPPMMSALLLLDVMGCLASAGRAGSEHAAAARHRREATGVRRLAQARPEQALARGDVELGAVRAADDAVARGVQVGMPAPGQSACRRAGSGPARRADALASAHHEQRVLPGRPRVEAARAAVGQVVDAASVTSVVMRAVVSGSARSAGGRRPADRRPLLALTGTGRSASVGADRRLLARRPGLVVQVHVGVVLDMAAQRAVEVPEPVRAEAVAPGPPEALVALALRSAVPASSTSVGPPMWKVKCSQPFMNGGVWIRNSVWWSSVPAGRRKGPTPDEAVGADEAQPSRRRPRPWRRRARSTRRATASAAARRMSACTPSCVGRRCGARARRIDGLGRAGAIGRRTVTWKASAKPMSSTAAQRRRRRRVHLAVAPSSRCDGVQRGRVGDAVDGLAQHARGAQRRRQRRVVLVRGSRRPVPSSASKRPCAGVAARP